MDPEADPAEYPEAVHPTAAGRTVAGEEQAAQMADERLRRGPVPGAAVRAEAARAAIAAAEPAAATAEPAAPVAIPTRFAPEPRGEHSTQADSAPADAAPDDAVAGLPVEGQEAAATQGMQSPFRQVDPSVVRRLRLPSPAQRSGDIRFSTAERHGRIAGTPS